MNMAEERWLSKPRKYVLCTFVAVLLFHVAWIKAKEADHRIYAIYGMHDNYVAQNPWNFLEW